MKNITRREFIRDIGLLTALGYIGYREFDINNKQTKLTEMYDNIGDYVHEINSHIRYITPTNNKEHETDIKAYGIVKNGMLYTVAHVVEMSEYVQRTPFGMMKVPVNTIESETKLNNITLDKLVCDTNKDIAVLKLPKFYTPPEFPGKFDDPVAGEEVYVIGNPALTGVNIRRGYVSDMDGLNGQPYHFGYSVPLIGGDSGTPILNCNFDIIGLNSHSFQNVIGYAVRITEAEKLM